ncbi:hypothetical protein [Nonlabens sp. Asnod3-H03]
MKIVKIFIDYQTVTRVTTTKARDKDVNIITKDILKISDVDNIATSNS